VLGPSGQRWNRLLLHAGYRAAGRSQSSTPRP